MFVVRKQGCDKPRIVQDFRAQNEASLPDRYLGKSIRECLTAAGLSKPTVFSCLDLTGAFHQLGLASQLRGWSAFKLPFLGLQFQWTRCPQGLRGAPAPASFSKLICLIFSGYQHVTTYVDDMLVTARDHDAMLLHSEEAMAELCLHGLKLNMKKCKYGFQQINWLGFKTSGKGVQPDSSKVEHVGRMTPPTKVSEIKSQLAFFQFNAPMVEKIQWTMQPLQALTSPNSNWRSLARSRPLPEKAMKAWLELKRILLSEPCIAWPDTSLPF